MLLQSKLEQLLALWAVHSRLETAMALATIYRDAAASPDAYRSLGPVGWFGGFRVGNPSGRRRFFESSFGPMAHEWS